MENTSNRTAFLRNGIEKGKDTIQAVEEQAQSFFEDLRNRGNRELESLRERIPADTLKSKLPVEDLFDRARSVESETRTRAEALLDDAERRFQELQSTVLKMTGVASQEQVASLARDLDRLSRRLDRLARQKKAAASAAKKKTTKKSSAKAGKARG